LRKLRFNWRAIAGFGLVVLVVLGGVAYRRYGQDLLRPGWGDLRQDFDVVSLHADVDVQPGEGSMTSGLSLALRANREGARVFHLVSRHILENRDYLDAQLVPDDPGMTVRELALQRQWRAWRVVLEEPVAVGEELVVRLEIQTTVDNRYPQERLWQGIVAKGVYGMEWLPYIPGVLDAAKWMEPEDITARISIPTDFVLVSNPYHAAYHCHGPGVYDITAVYQANGGLLFAGPWAFSERFEVADAGGIVVETHTYTEDRAADYRRWAAETLPVYHELFGTARWLSERDTMVIVEFPREHGGGVRYDGLIGMVEELTPGLSHAVALDLLAYHELGHSWDLMHRIEGDWQYDYEALTQYKVFLLLEKLSGWQRAMEYLEEREAAYWEAAAGRRVPAIATADLQHDDPLRQPLFYDRGVWIWHGLRFLMGEDAFRKLLTDVYQGEEIDYREFADMVERLSGGPTRTFLDQSIHERGLVELAATGLESTRQGQEGYATSFDLVSMGAVMPPRVEVELVGDEGATQVEIVQVQRGVVTHELLTPFRVTGIRLDPRHWFLADTPSPEEVASALRWRNTWESLGCLRGYPVPLVIGLLLLGLAAIVGLVVRRDSFRDNIQRWGRRRDRVG